MPGNGARRAVVSAEPVRHLRLVDSDTGEWVQDPSELPELKTAQTQIAMLERERAGQRLRIAALEADKSRERAEHPRRRDIERCHRYWQKRCDHPRAGLDNATFFAIAAMMGRRVKREPEFRWPEDFKRAIDGAHYDPYITTRKNGSQKRHDDLGLIFRDAAHVREFIAKAPVPA